MSLFKSLSGFVGGVVSSAGDALSQITDIQAAEGFVAIMTATAHADGDFEEEERKKMATFFQKHPTLAQFDSSKLMAKFNELNDQYTLDVDIGHEACFKELRDIAKKDQKVREAVLAAGVAIARADGAIEPAEYSILKQCARHLGVSEDRVPAPAA